MITSYHGKKITANQKAKELVFTHGTNADYWTESTDLEKYTQREIEEIDKAIKKQINRVDKFLFGN